MKKGRQDRIAETLTSVKDVNTVFYMICSQEVSVNELICVV